MLEYEPQPLPWFDRSTGQLLIGQSAIAACVEESGIGDIVPLGTMLNLKPSQTTSLGYERHQYPEWQTNDYISYGHWTIRIIEAQTAAKRVVRDHFQNMYHLGLGPSRKSIEEQFGTFIDFKVAINSPVNKTQGLYEHWQLSDYVEYALELATRVDGKPLESDYQSAFHRGEGPSPAMIFQIGESITGLNARLRYPNIHSWTEEDFIQWGVRTLRANQGTGLTSRLIDQLSKQHLGPSCSTVVTHFGKLATFQRLIWEELAKDDQLRAQRRQSRHP
jgi:hypothetical protein